MKVPAGAVWIGSDHPFDLHEAYLNFRCDVTLARAPDQAALFITADSRYRLWINGQFVARGPSRCWPHAQQVDEIDVAGWLRPGRNAIAVQVYSPGYSHFAHVHRGVCGLLVWLDVEGAAVLVTGTSWRVMRDPSWSDLVLRVSIYGSGVERRDLRLEPTWLDADIGGAEWGAPRVVALAEGPLWRGLALRDVPLLKEETETLGSVWRFKREPSSPHADPHLRLREAWAGGTTEPAPVAATVRPRECLMWTFDLGASATCNASVVVKGARGGERLMVCYAEKLRDGDLLISDPTTYCRMRPTDEFTLRAGDQVAEGFSQRGARYIVFALESEDESLVDLTFTVHRTRYPLQLRPPQLADIALQSIAAMCLRTLEACLQDGFVDSVWRESSQWLGDCVAQAFALAAVSGDHRPLRRAITMAAAGAYDDGVLPSVLPGEVHAYTIVDYNFSWIELLAMYRGPDRDELLAAMLPVASRMLDRFAQDIGEDGLIHSQPGRRLFLDWSPVDRREPSLTYNGRHLYALQLAAELGVAGAAERAERLRQNIATGFHHDGHWHENSHSIPASQLGLALLLLTGCSNPSLAEPIIARSLDLDDSPSPDKLVLASPFMHHYVFLALDRVSRRDDIVAIIRARWGRWAEAEEPTCWENWNVNFPDGSKCHGFSAHPLGWLLKP